MKSYIGQPMSRKSIREIAMMIRDITGFKNRLYFPVIEFLEIVMPKLFDDFNYEIRTKEEMGNDYALTYPEKKLIAIREDVYDNAVAGKGRDRFTIAHEIGHFVLHSKGNLQFARSEEEVKDIPAYMKPEWQANTFAGELLAPPHLIKDLSAFEVACKCGVSYEAGAIQLNQIK